jgi:hypothetical protein
MSVRTKSIGALFVVLAIILVVNPRMVNNVYETILGRLFLIGIVIFFAMNNITLGLLAVLAIIVASNQFSFLVEGMENNVTTDKPPVQIQMPDKKKTDEVEGVDKEDIKNAIMSKDSKQLPVVVSKSDEVTASSESILNPSAKLEGFSSYANY